MNNPFKRFFIKDYLHKYHMANNNKNQQQDNIKNLNNQVNPAAPDGGAGVPNGGPNPSTIVAVDGQGNPVENTGVLNGGGGGGEGSVQAPEDSGLDIEKLIEESTKEIKTGDEAQEARKKKQELLMRAINSRMYIENIIFKNTETDEQVGTKMRYIKDPYGKTIYDYMNDPEITAHLGFKVSENDPKDGSPIEKQISIYWNNPVF